MADIPATIRNRLVDYLRGAGAPTAISGIYLELFNGDPQGAGSSVQSAVTGSSTRTNVTSALGAASSGASTNASTITITASASGSATVTHVGLYDASSAGNLLASHALTSGTLSVSATNPVQINASGLTLSIA